MAEDGAGSLAFFRGLTARGLTGVRVGDLRLHRGPASTRLAACWPESRLKGNAPRHRA